MGGRIVLGVLLIAAGLVAAVAIALPPFLDVKDRIESFPKTRLSEGAVQLEAREYDVYLEVPTGTGDFGWTLSVRDGGGADVPLRRAPGSVTYSWFGRDGERIAKLRVARAGRHLVRGTGPPGARVVFARDVIGGIGRSLLLAGIAFLALVAAGIVVIVLGVARRPPQEPKRWP